ncbi:uncharacterized protein LOC142235300 [Haematobia irritans]|uniref:uncharacterized protein LOC142235300 n=1 Tax=Haematobia irritans TaxID=7368 RepID=UPI003F50B798
MKWENLKFLITFGVVLLFCNQNCLAWRAYKVILTAFQYETNANLLDAKIQIQNTSADTSVNVVLNVLEDIDDIALTYSLAIEGEQANNYTTMLSHKVQFCKFLQQRSLDAILHRLYEDILKQGTFIKTCPLKKSNIYTLSDYHVDEELLPQYCTETNFYVDIQMDKGNVENVMLLKGRLQGKIDKSKGFNNLKMFSMG